MDNRKGAARVRLVFMGPPGAGKGTQAKQAAERYGIPHVSSGDIFRAEIAAQTDLGERIKGYLDAGDLVPDETTVRAVVGRIQADDCRDGWLLDGFPRTEPQARALDEALQEQGHHLDAVVYLSVDPEVIVRRMSGRRVCPACGRSYHRAHPAQDGRDVRRLRGRPRHPRGRQARDRPPAPRHVRGGDGPAHRVLRGARPAGPRRRNRHAGRCPAAAL